jgi:hypothetical protein
VDKENIFLDRTTKVENTVLGHGHDDTVALFVQRRADPTLISGCKSRSNPDFWAVRRVVESMPVQSSSGGYSILRMLGISGSGEVT